MKLNFFFLVDYSYTTEDNSNKESDEDSNDGSENECQPSPKRARKSAYNDKDHSSGEEHKVDTNWEKR